MSHEPAEAGGLHIELDVPLSWRPLDGNETAAAWERAGNVLHLLNLQGERHGEEAQGELRHLEQKLDVVIAMLGMLLEEPAKAGPPIPVRLEPHRLCWPDPHAPAPGSAVLVSLRLPGAPVLAMPGIVQETEAGKVCAGFDGMPASSAELLEKWIFRQHRQAVARSRAGRS